MAIINSVVIGRGRKSVGEVTLRNDRGRTIATRRIVENKSNTTLQQTQRQNFGLITKALHGLFNYYMNRLAVKSRYGSQRNHYYKINKLWLEAAIAEWRMLEPKEGETMDMMQAMMGMVNAMKLATGQNNLAGVPVEGAAVVGNKDCTQMVAAESGQNQYVIYLEDVKDGDLENIVADYIIFEYKEDTNGNEIPSRINVISGDESDWDVKTKPELGLMSPSRKEGGVIGINYIANSNKDTARSDSPNLHLKADTVFYIAIPYIEYRTTKDERKVCTMSWGAICAGAVTPEGD